MSEPRRIGIFGGTFDPIHNTHLDIARAALDRMNLDKVVFVVAGEPPHKQSEIQASPQQRYDMVCAAVGPDPRMDVSRVEIDRGGVSYSVDTLRHFRKVYPDAKLYLILGWDSLLDFPQWKDPQDILRYAELVVAPRGDGDTTLPENVDVPFTLLDFEPSDISSTEVREDAGLGKDLSSLAPEPVIELIEEQGLYGAHVVHRSK